MEAALWRLSLFMYNQPEPQALKSDEVEAKAMPETRAPGFGPLRSRDEPQSDQKIIGLVMEYDDKFPKNFAKYIISILGDPCLQMQGEDEIIQSVWRLDSARPYYSDEWQRLMYAFEHQAQHLYGIEMNFKILDTYGIDEAKLKEYEPILSTISGSGYQLLLDQHEALRQHFDSPAPEPKKEATGWQPTMNATWAALEQSDLPPVARMTLLAILKECRSKSSADIYLDTLVAKTGAKKRTLQTTAFPALVDGGWIRIKHAHNNRSTYTIVNKKFIPPYFKKSR